MATDPNTQAPAAPDLSALAQPGAATPPTANASLDPAAVQAQMAPFQAKEQAATQKAADLANEPAPNPNVPHARLLAMVQGLSVGLSAFGTSLATHGAEGGAKEVQQIQAAQQEQKLQAQAAATAQKNAQIQQQLMIGDTNPKLAQNVLLMATLPSDLTKRDLETKSAQLGVIGQTQDIRTKALQDLVATGDLDAYNNTLKQVGAAGGVTTPSGATPAATPAGAAPSAPGTVPPMAVAQWKNATDAAVSAYPNDPTIKQYADVLADPNSDPKAMAMAATGARNRMAALDAGAESRTKQEAAAKGARPTDLNDATGRLAQAQQAYAANPSPETKAAADAASATQQSFLEQDRQQKQIAQDVVTGDPSVIGEAMASGVYAPSQVLSARSMSKPIYTKAVQAADDYAKAHGAPEIIGPNGEHTGKYFDAAVAENQYKMAQSPQTQQVLNKIVTLNEPGGDFDILKDAASSLPQMDEQTINKVFNAGATEFGNPAATKYHMALYNLASLLSQVQTGGVPNEGEIQEQLNLMKAALSKGQIDGALSVARQDIAARGKSYVTGNPYLRNQYPNLLNGTPESKPSPAGSAASKLHASLTDFTHTVKSKNGLIYSDDGKTWYDQAGNLIGGK